MQKQKLLKPKQQLAVKLLALGEEQQKVAEVVGVCVMTIYRWQQIAVFQEQLEAVQNSGLVATAKKLHVVGITACECLQEFINDMKQPPEVRARLALGIMRSYPAMHAALQKGLRHRVGDFQLDEQWSMPTGTFDSFGRPCDRGGLNALTMNADGAVVL